MGKLHNILLDLERENQGPRADRIFYFAIPPFAFADAAAAIGTRAMVRSGGYNRMVIEKPFGHDLDSYNALAANLSKYFAEEQMYRIDHYLGKEMVQNLMALRFANSVFEPLWNNNHITSVQITFKEDIGTEGRGGYFDKYGIIRDVMQNHLTQIVSLVAMEPPVSTSAEHVRDEKVKVLQSMDPIRMEDIVLGQYVKGQDGKPGYLDDDTVPQDSTVPTFALVVAYINNRRWDGVPFILKCGKALNERKAEIRIQFKKVPGKLFESSSPNELVMRVQPDEAVYLKVTAKVPGFSLETAQTELDLSYKSRYADTRLPDAYERLIFDVIRGDHSLFVRHDELAAAWGVFSPMLQQLEENKVPPIKYERGSRGPAEADALVARHYTRDADYSWTPKQPAA